LEEQSAACSAKGRGEVLPFNEACEKCALSLERERDGKSKSLLPQHLYFIPLLLVMHLQDD
jgi:hypothetical protein